MYPVCNLLRIQSSPPVVPVVVVEMEMGSSQTPETNFESGMLLIPAEISVALIITPILSSVAALHSVAPVPGMTEVSTLKKTAPPPYGQDLQGPVPTRFLLPWRRFDADATMSIVARGYRKAFIVTDSSLIRATHEKRECRKVSLAITLVCYAYGGLVWTEKGHHRLIYTDLYDRKGIMSVVNVIIHESE